jgi:hypothetical protein
MAFFVKDDVSDEVPNGTPKISNSFLWGGKLGC